MKHTGLTLAAAAAALVVAGCTTPGDTTTNAQPVPITPSVAPTYSENSCKGNSRCKGMSKRSYKKRHRMKNGSPQQEPASNAADSADLEQGV